MPEWIDKELATMPRQHPLWTPDCPPLPRFPVDMAGDSRSFNAPIRFSLLVQSSHTTRQRVATMVQEQLKQIGVVVDIVPMDPGSLVWNLSEN